MYNLLSGAGFSRDIMGDWSMAILGLGIIVFIGLVSKGQSEDGLLQDVGYNWVIGMACGILGYIVLISFVGSAFWSMLVGIVSLIAGGFGLGYVINGGGNE